MIGFFFSFLVAAVFPTKHSFSRLNATQHKNKGLSVVASEHKAKESRRLKNWEENTRKLHIVFDKDVAYT